MSTTDLYRALWRHKLFIAVLTALMVGGAWFLTSRAERIYEASSLVRVQQEISDPGQTLGVLTAGAQLAETYSKVVETSTVSEGIVERLDGDASFADVSGSLSAEPVQGLDLLWISARSPSPERAKAIADAAPWALAQFIRETGTLRDRVITVQTASVPTSPVSPNVMLNLAIAFLVGLIFNAALALLLDLFSDRVATLEDLERLTGRPVLAVVPTLKLGYRPQAVALPEDEATVRPMEVVRGAASGG